MKKFIVIHGEKIKYQEFKNIINSCLQRKWNKRAWRKSPALLHKDGTLELFNNQRFIPENTVLIENGWEHDHCEICGWVLNDESNEEKNTGYVDSNYNWICNECYINFIDKNKRVQNERK